MPKLIFVIGATATGKTYFIKQNYENKGVDILNIYDYQQRVYDEEGFGNFIPFGAKFECLMRANQLLLDDIVAKLSQGHDVVAEQTKGDIQAALKEMVQDMQLARKKFKGI